MLRRFRPLVLLLALSGTMLPARTLNASPGSSLDHPRSHRGLSSPTATLLPGAVSRAGDLRAYGGAAVEGRSAAEPPQDTATLRGRVTNATGDPIAGAQLLLLGTRVRLITDADGAFVAAGLPTGMRQVEIRLLGYQTQRVGVELRQGEAASVAVALVPEPLALEGVHVEAARSRNAFGGFYERKARGPGHFISREEIERRRPRQLTDLLRLVPGLALNPGPYGTFDVELSRARTAASACRITVFLNGVAHGHTGLTNLDGLRVTEIEGVEIYRNPGEVPARFRGPNASCGVIAVWIRDGAPVRHGRS